MAYCKPTGSVCPGEGTYPSVSEGQISVTSCIYGYRGYSYRECSGGMLGPVVNDNCTLIPPDRIRYSSDTYVFVLEESVSTGTPSYKYIVQNWYLVSQTLPTGLSLNETTGEISGIPTTAVLSTVYSIYGGNSVGSASASISLEVIPQYIFYPQTVFVIGVGCPFSLTPTLTRSAFISIIVGSLPLGLSINDSSGTIDGTPSESISAQSVTINAQSGLASQKVVLVFTVMMPISSLSYPQDSYIIPRDEQFASTPSVMGEQPVYSVSSGELPAGLRIDSSSGVISGSPSESVTSQTVTIKAANPVSSQTVTLSFTTRIRPSSLQYPQNEYYIPTNVTFTAFPECNGDFLQYSLKEGSLPAGLKIDQKSGAINGTPLHSTQLTAVTVEAANEVGSILFTLSICVRVPLSGLRYPHISFTLVKRKDFSTIPVIQGDVPRFHITSDNLPDRLMLNESTGEISGVPLTATDLVDVTIQARNEVGSIETALSFVVKAFSTSTLILLCVCSLVLVSVLIIVGIFMINKKLHNRSTKTDKANPWKKL